MNCSRIISFHMHHIQLVVLVDMVVWMGPYVEGTVEMQGTARSDLVW